jgi:hypothetical protein
MVLARYDERPIPASTFVGKNLSDRQFLRNPLKNQQKYLHKGTLTAYNRALCCSSRGFVG